VFPFKNIGSWNIFSLQSPRSQEYHKQEGSQWTYWLVFSKTLHAILIVFLTFSQHSWLCQQLFFVFVEILVIYHLHWYVERHRLSLQSST